ncbi:MAG: helix-turn-helix transcriptional regulator [Clostridia bacterium]|nr:helix-turn-helix transcriptional regulator [Clostridia bacterium]
MNIGENIREHRIALGMTQEVLAKKLCVSSQAVSKWETGKSCPDVSLILPISEAFNISADELLGKTKYDSKRTTGGIASFLMRIQLFHYAMRFDEFEKIIITDIIEQYPEYKQRLRSQLERILLQKREFFTYGFSTYYDVVAVEETLGDDKNLQLGKLQWNINGLNYGVDFILWIKNGFISCLEGFSYNELWPNEIQ